ncbi:SDR family NAD(P)-dependent oxidoreductase [Glaciecola siphonariae]|uniref:SDR family NAD(P)-dependent oxidoreductase n=1 Tax=Glaciecola siphonariae TaxID=521012 RepID=A0ABV9LX42_9ALTE
MGKISSLDTFFTGKTVVITGAGSGIGKGLAKTFAHFNCKLALCDIDEQALQTVVKELSVELPNYCEDNVFSSAFDVSDRAQWDDFLSNTAQQHQHIDVLINNAGIEGSCRPVWASDEQSLQRVMDVNFYGMVHGCKAVLPYLSQRPWAALLNVSSIFGLIAPPNTADYCASKFAIRGYTESLRAELSLIHPHIQVHLIHPGGINTNITRLEQSQKFKHRFLTTAPTDIAMYIAKCIMQNKARIVYGNKSGLAHFASRFFPLSWLNKISAREVKSLGLEEDYRDDHPGFTTRSNKK